MVLAQLEQLDNITYAIVQLGLPVCLVIFFVWWTWNREEKTVTKQQAMDKFIREELMKVVGKMSEQVALSTKVIQDSQQVLEENHTVLKLLIDKANIDYRLKNMGKEDG